MSKKMTITLIMAAFVIGTAVGVAVAKKKNIDPGLYMGVEPQQAMGNLMVLAEEQAGKGSWENLHVARVYILAGDTEKGEAIIEGVLDRGKREEASDWIRVGRIWIEADQWDKAKEAFDNVIRLEPKDEDWLAEVGAFYNLNGDRETAEQYFVKSFELDPDNHHNTAIAAGSYVGISPR